MLFYCTHPCFQQIFTVKIVSKNCPLPRKSPHKSEVFLCFTASACLSASVEKHKIASWFSYVPAIWTVTGKLRLCLVFVNMASPPNTLAQLHVLNCWSQISFYVLLLVLLHWLLSLTQYCLQDHCFLHWQLCIWGLKSFSWMRLSWGPSLNILVSQNYDRFCFSVNYGDKKISTLCILQIFSLLSAGGCLTIYPVSLYMQRFIFIVLHARNVCRTFILVALPI